MASGMENFGELSVLISENGVGIGLYSLIARGRDVVAVLVFISAILEKGCRAIVLY